MSSSPSPEEQLKAIMPLMQRAQEIQQADPKVAYYCRMYAVEQALTFPQRSKDVSDLVSIALSQMEKDRGALALDKENDMYHCESFALKIFSNADKMDRAGRADLATAKAFFVASYFLEVLNHFGPLDQQLGEKQRYAAWRAAELSKAMREGRPPLPPSNPKEEVPQTEIDDLPLPGSSSQGLPSSPPPPLQDLSSYTPLPPPPVVESVDYKAGQWSDVPIVPFVTGLPTRQEAGHINPPPPFTAPSSAKPSIQAIVEAQKNAKYAVSSLNFEDIPSAIGYLQSALRLLQQ